MNSEPVEQQGSDEILPNGNLLTARPSWSRLIAVCQKCEHGPTQLRDRLKEAVAKRKIAATRVIKSSCLDVCPKNGTTVSILAVNLTTVILRDDNDIAVFLSLL